MSWFKRSKKHVSQLLRTESSQNESASSKHDVSTSASGSAQQYSIAPQNKSQGAQNPRIDNKGVPQPISALCQVCQFIEFPGVLAPQAYDHGTRRFTTFLRPNEGTSSYNQSQTRKQTLNIVPKLPIISSASYGDLSDSEDEDYGRPYQPPKMRHSPSNHQHKVSDKGGTLDTSQDDQVHEYTNRQSRSSSVSSAASHFMEVYPIDLEKQVSRNPNYFAGQFYDLGSIFDVRSRRHECALCRRLWKRMRTEHDIRNTFMVKSKAILKLIDFQGLRADSPTDRVSMLNFLFIFGWKTERNGTWLTKNSFILQGRLRQLDTPHSLLPFNANLYGQARIRGETCNFELIKAWLYTCQTQHNHPIPLLEETLFLRLVDVHKLCIFEWTGSASNVPRYVALSYTWGSSKPEVQLTKASLVNFQSTDALNVPLNPTLADAISLVEKIGERYIWIDCLSIIQDSHEDQMKQIQQMHHVYARSTLTIVSGIAGDADYGLPRVLPRSAPRFTLQLPEMEISFRGGTKVHHSLTREAVGLERNYLRDMRYLSRAWTYQEGYLAPRIIVFTKDQVFWECDRCTWCEETHWESKDINYVGQRAIKQAMPQEEFNDASERKAYDLPVEDDGIQGFDVDNYAAIVKEYTSRQLSFDSDILHACAGVLLALTVRDDTHFIHGLRTRYFGNDLLFNMSKASVKRFTADSDLSNTIPSWTWAFWHGQIEIANQPRHNSYDIVENLVPCDGVKCYMLMRDPATGEESLYTINEHGGWRFEVDYVRSGEGIFDPAEEGLQQVLPSEQSVSATAIQRYRQDLTMDDVREHRAQCSHAAGNHWWNALTAWEWCVGTS